MGRRRGRVWAPVWSLVVLALVVPVVQGEVTGLAASGGPSAAAATPPVGVWGFDAVAAVGTGSGGFGGDGGPAAAASMRQPGDVVASPDGATWYVADTGNDRIRAVDVASGVISTVAGSDRQCRRDVDPGDVCGDGGPATAATLNRPGGVALSGDGTVLYIADTFVNLVRAVTLASGVITTLAGTGSEGFGGDGGPATAAQLAGPSGVAAASDGSVYVADTLNNALRRVAPDGTISTSAGTGIGCVDPSTACGDGGPATAAQLSAPVGVSAGPPEAGIVVADTGNHRVRLIGADGVITTVAGTGVGGSSGDGGPATAAQLNEPKRAVVGPGGAVYIADTANHRIRVVVQGTIWAVAGTGSAASGPSGEPSWGTGLQRPDGLAVTSTGVVVADTANHVLRAMSVPHAVLSFTVCGPDPATPGGLTSAEIPLAGLPTPAFVTADVFGAAGGRAGAAVGGGGGYAHGTVRVDPATDRLVASVGCHGGDGGGAGGGGGGGASTVEVIDASGAGAAVLIAGGGGGAGAALAGCPAAGGHGWPGGHGVGSGGGAAVAVSGGNHGGGGEGGMQPGKVTVPSGTSGFGGPGGTGGGDGGGVGGWGRSPDPDPPGPAPAGAGGNGITANGHFHLPCLGTGGGGGGYGGGATGDTRVAGGAGGGSYGVCADPATGARSTGDGSIVVEITTSAPTSCTPPRPAPATSPRDDAHARVWAAADAISDAEPPPATPPVPLQPHVPAASTAALVPDCPPLFRSTDSPGPAQVRFTVPNDSWMVGAGNWVESASECPIFSSILANCGPSNSSSLTIDPGPGTLLMLQLKGEPQQFVVSQSPSVLDCDQIDGGAVVDYVDALKLFNQCPGCDLSGMTLANVTFPPETVILSDATLSGATIFNVDLTGARLDGAILGPDGTGKPTTIDYSEFGNVVLLDATLSGVRISNTDMTQVLMDGARFLVDGTGRPTTLSNQVFEGFSFSDVVFDQTVFDNVTFRAVAFSCTTFRNMVLLGQSFTFATWSSPSCTSPTFENTVLPMDTVPAAQWPSVSFDHSTVVVDTATRALLKGSTMPSWTFTNSQFVGVPPDLSGITVTGATLDGSSFVLADLTGATFNAPTSVQHAVFIDATLDNAKLPGAVGHGAVFTGASLEGAVFDQAQLGAGADSNLATATFGSADAHGASFENVEARLVQFDHAYLYPGDAAVSFSGATLEGATFSGAVLGQTDFTDIHGAAIGFEGAQCVNCDFTGAAMAGAHFDSAWVYGAAFKGATMANASFVNAACCGSGTWTYSLGNGAAAPAEPYAADPQAPSLNGPEFDNISLCPSGFPPSSPGGCQGKTVPQQPPPQPECSAAADHDCVLDIVLLAGDGTAGYSDGGIQQDAKLAAFNSPGDVAYDPNTGDALVADTTNGVVRRISQVSSSSPHISIVAGSPPAAGTPAVVEPPLKRTRPLPGAVRAVPTLIAPTGVATTTVGSVTTIGMADQKSHIVFTTTGAGAPQPLAGTGAACAAPTDACGDGDAASRAELNAPQGIWFDPTGNLYIADTGDNRVRKVDTTGVITTVAGTGLAGYSGDSGAASAAELDGPIDVVGDQLGNLYVADAGNAAIRRIDPGGNITTLAGGADGSLTRPTSITVDGRNRLYLTDAGANIVATLNVFGIARPAAGTGTAGYSGDGGPALSAQLNGPLGVAAVGDDALYIADTANQRIRTVQPASS